MKEYLFDMHVHTSETSFCAKECAHDVCEKYKALGYDGIVITDHVNFHTFEDVLDKSWDEQADKFLSGYRAAKKCETPDFKVLLGMEMRCTENKNDYLTYGFDESFIYEHKDLQLTPNISSFRKICKENGLIIFQAHPFRRKMTVIDPTLIDGIEVYNANPDYDSNNELAELWAKKYSLKTISGTDYHGKFGSFTGGVYFLKRPENEKELLELLKNQQYRVKKP